MSDGLRRCGCVVLLAVPALGWAGPVGYGDPTEPYPIPGTESPAAESAAPAAPPEPRWILSSTLVAGARRVAVINGRSVAVGATIDGARLVAVDGRGALIEVRGRRLRLRMPDEEGAGMTAKTPRGP